MGNGIRFGFAVVAVGLLTAALQAPPTGPTGYWPLDETASPAINAAGAYSNGNWSGPATSNQVPPLITYPDPNCLTFDGTDDYVEFANSAALENVQENSYTLSAWYFPTDVPVAGANEGRYAILYKAGWHEGIAYTRDGSGNGQFVFEHWLTGDVWEGAQTGGAYPPAAWYHVAGVMDRALGLTTLYVNGTSVATNTWTANSASREYGANPWRIGSANPGAAYGSYRWAAKGRIDDPRIYARALTLPEIQILALGVPTPTNVVATPGVQQVSVDWDPPLQPAGFTAYTYNLYVSVNGAAPTLVQAGLTQTQYTDPTAINLGNNPSFVYSVVAVSVATSGPASSPGVTPTLPPPRTNTHEEGLLDGDCACGSSVGGALPAGLLAALAGLALALAARRQARGTVG